MPPRADIYHFFVSILILSLACNAAASTTTRYFWTWLSGEDNTSNFAGNYGIINVSSSSNLPPSRQHARMWCDEVGKKLYIYGGEGNSSSVTARFFSDLWSFDLKTQRWTWEAGQAGMVNALAVYGIKNQYSSTNTPGHRVKYSAWLNPQNRTLLLFGGLGGRDFGYNNDLWEFSLDSKQWRWLNGYNGTYGNFSLLNPVNPGPMNLAVGLTDTVAKRLWLLFGYGKQSLDQYEYLNLVWYGNGSSWNFYSGDTETTVGAVHGPKFVSGASEPGGREAPAAWIDSQTATIWIFGGKTNIDGKSVMADLFQLDTASTNWTWIGGSKFSDEPGDWGLLGSPRDSNMPSARQDSATLFNAATRELILFGGKFSPAPDNQTFWNDLWSFNLATNQWTWVGGSNSASSPGIYPYVKNLTFPDAEIRPPARASSASCTIGNSLYIFGGLGRSGPGSSFVYFNDLWRLDVVTTTDQPPTSVCPGTQPSPDFFCNATTGSWVLNSTAGSTVVTPTLNVTSPSLIPVGSTLVVTGSASVQCSGAIDLQGQLIVQGNASFCGVLSFPTLASNSINVSSCANFSGVQLNFQAQSIANQLANSANGTFSLDLAQFATGSGGTTNPPPVTLLGVDPNGCIDISSTSQLSDRSLSVVFTSQEKASCRSATPSVSGPVLSIIGLAVGLSLAGLVIIAIAVSLLVPSIRRKIFPYRAESNSPTNGRSTID